MRILSGIQPTGELHIGNYLGMVRQAIKLQETEECFYLIVDLHALTENPEPQKLRENTVNLILDLLALGIDPARSTLFVQSQIAEHSELMWLLTTITPIGELERMTQYKDKAQRAKDGVNAGLLMYPALMAADILLYKAEGVPVGEDQEQHLELTRSIARKFNGRFGKLFPEPKTLLVKQGARVMSLADPSKKMSKSLGSDHYLGLFEDQEGVRKKLQRAITDSGAEIVFDPKTKPALANLLTIFQALDGRPMKEIEKAFAGKGYAEFKRALSELYVRYFAPARIRREQLAQEPERVGAYLKQGLSRAQKIATETIREVRERVGLR